ncbi:MAG: DUF2336 domain-containing protein [Alphaproteobacteria bacterium]
MAKKSALKLRDYGAPDLDSLVGLARQKSAAGRRTLFKTVRDLFLEAEDTLSDRERALMGDILRKLVLDIELSMRKDLSERLAEDRLAPRELLVTLANDEIEVAYPVLIKSTVLQDIDLIEIVRHRTQAHQLTIARRRNVAEDVSQALVDAGDVDVVTALIKNDGAEISRSLMEYLVAESKRVDSFQNPLVGRRDLPPDLAHKMYWWVSAAVRQHIVENFNIDPTTLDDAVETTVNAALERDGLKPTASEPSEAEKVAGQLAERGQLNEKFILQTLRQGEAALFEACFAAATGVPLKLTRRLLYEPGGEALAVACKASDFERATFATIFKLTREASAKEQPFDVREMARVTEFFDRIEKDKATAMIKRWRRDSDYLYALRQIEENT